jgi:hypothetical protein
MENKLYIVIKELPDADVGTEVKWSENENCFYYDKTLWVSPHNKSYLSKGQVMENPEYFTPAEQYQEYYAYKNPVYNREEILNLLNTCFPNKTISGQFHISVSKEIEQFKSKLRELGLKNAKNILKSNVQ